MKRKIGILSLGILLLAGCGKVKLENGKEAVVTFKDDVKISIDDLYEEMKDTYALQTLVNMVDSYILETEFKDYIDTAKDYAKSYVDGMAQNYDSEDAFLQALQAAGISSKEAYQDTIYTSYMENHAVEEYAKTLVTDKDIEDYYNDKAKGDIELSHILISPKTNSDMTTDEKDKAKDEAKKKAEDLLKQINEAEDKVAKFKELVKDNSDDDATKDAEGAFGKRLTYGDLSSSYDELLDAAYSINDNEVYGKVVTTELGYHIVLKTKTYEKESLDDLKEEIIDILSEDLLNNTADISINALQYYRKNYELDIKDSELKRQYDNYIKRALASTSSNTTAN